MHCDVLLAIGIVVVGFFLLFLQDDRVYSQKRQQNYDINEEKRNEAKQSKQNKKEKKTPNRSSPFICLFIVHAIVTMVLPNEPNVVFL